MKRKGYTSPLTKRILSVLGLVVLPLFSVSQTQAKGPGSVPGKSAMAVIYLDNLGRTNINNSAEFKTRLLHVIALNARLKPKSVRELPKGCGCSAVAPDAAGSGFWTCLKHCMADAGVSAVSMIGCGASCAAAETGVGAIVCAVCVGVSVTVIEVCAIGCVMNGGKGFGALMEARAIRHRQATSGSLQAKLRLQPTRVRS
jgi:hypothetical protein